jgi:putative ubiquitin-RnfH superfamily antitoxin RatB of RatAB toxin-antitoxin module
MESLDEPSRQQLRVEIVYSPRAGHVVHARLTLAAGSTLADALRESGFAVPDGTTVGIWGRLLAAANALATPLHDRDRIEFHRPLAVDPMETRRRRALGQRGAAAAKHGRR